MKATEIEEADYSRRTLLVNAPYLAIYAGWWLYALYFFYCKEYDNGYAAAIASLGVGGFSLLFTVAYSIAYIIKALKASSQRRFYWLVLLVVNLPALGMLLAEVLKPVFRPA